MKFPTLLVGRILFSIPFVSIGLMHVISANKMSGMVPPWLPGGVVWVYVVGIADLCAAASILSGKKTVLAGQLLACLLVIIVATVHVPAMLGAADEVGRMMSMSALLKDLGLAGGALLVSHIYRQRS
ncbi:MAG: DoxX family membrane protein [Candidatus Kapabacteria bacterium]|nr:DoxX family membrane protein [Candidatus Kapabacteria bacterium]